MFIFVLITLLYTYFLSPLFMPESSTWVDYKTVNQQVSIREVLHLHQITLTTKATIWLDPARSRVMNPSPMR